MSRCFHLLSHANTHPHTRSLSTTFLTHWSIEHACTRTLAFSLQHNCTLPDRRDTVTASLFPCFFLPYHSFFPFLSRSIIYSRTWIPNTLSWFHQKRLHLSENKYFLPWVTFYILGRKNPIRSDSSQHLHFKANIEGLPITAFADPF